MKNRIANPRCVVAPFRAMTFSLSDRARRNLATAFTLIEMLVVIAIIGILAGILVYVLPAANQKKVRSRVHAELVGLETAINSYHQKRGFYPPDNTNNSTGQPKYPPLNPLYYELTAQEPRAAVAADVFRDLGVAGILNATNSGPSAESQSFHKNLRPSNFGPLPASYTMVPPSQETIVLYVPYKGPNGEPNLWHYNSSNPTHNSDSYDLWAEVVVGNTTLTIGNWK